MTVQLGRLVVPGVVEMHTYATGEVRFAGALDVSSMDEALWYARQIVALAEDESPVPVILPDGWEGMGRVTSASWDPVLWEQGEGRWSVDVEPVRRHELPLCEVVVAGGPRPVDGDASIAERRGWAAAPASATEWSFRPTVSSGRVDTVRECEGGGVLYSSVANLYDHVASFRVPAAKWYEGGATVEQYVGGRWLPVVALGSLDRPWRVTNGLVRWTVTPDHLIEVEWWRPSLDAWHTPKRFHVRYFAGSNPRATWTAAEVVRNAAEEVRVRLSGRGRYAYSRTDLWVSVRRGSTSLDFTAKTGATPNFQMQPQPTAAITDSGAHAISADDGGLQWAYTSAGDFYLGTSAGTIGPTPTGALNWTWGLSGVQSAVTSLTATEVVRAWYASQTSRVTVGVI